MDIGLERILDLSVTLLAASLCEVIQVSIREMYDRHEEVQELVHSQLPPLPDGSSPNGLHQRSGPQNLAAYRGGV